MLKRERAAIPPEAMKAVDMLRTWMACMTDILSNDFVEFEM